MKLEDYIKQAKAELDTFELRWKGEAALNSIEWPLEMPEGEWAEQELAIRFGGIKMNIGFSIHQHDEDGEVWGEGIFIWIDDIFCVKVGNMDDLNEMITKLIRCKEEILETYGYIE
jgi:hypothetical protein